MAPGATAGIGRRPPSHGFGVRSMTTLTSQRTRMIAGITRRRVPECRWLPSSCYMAIIAILSRYEMRHRLAGRLCAGMADGASCCGVGMIERHWQPSHRCMARVTLPGDRKMRRCLAWGLASVVARAAGAEDLRMINSRCGCERNRAVTVGARRRRGDVGRRFAPRGRAVVAGGAGRRRLRVIHTRWLEGRGCMAGIACVGRWDVSGGLALGLRSVMASGARSADLGMVHLRHRFEGGRVVASGAVRC